MAKKSKTILFQVPEPCSENWNKMHSLPGGRFCDNCEKTVVDFSEMTDNELVRYFQENDHKLCGRFRPDQLDKEIELPRVPTSMQKWKSVATIAAGLLAWNSTSAQTPVPPENISIVDKTKTQKGVKSKEIKNNTTFSKNKLKGIVKDEKGGTLLGANILLEKNRGTTTDIDGKFELEIPEDWESYEITFSYLGYETQVIEFDKEDVLKGKDAEVRLTEMQHNMTPIEVIGYRVPVVRGLYTTGLTVTSIDNCYFDAKEEEEIETEEEIINEPISNIYPNPFVDYVNVLLELEKNQPYLFHLYNAKGQLIWAKTYDLAKGKQDLRLDFSEVKMAQGTHFLRITDGSREMQTKKIIKVNTKGEVPQILPVQQ